MIARSARSNPPFTVTLLGLVCLAPRVIICNLDVSRPLALVFQGEFEVSREIVHSLRRRERERDEVAGQFRHGGFVRKERMAWLAKDGKVAISQFIFRNGYSSGRKGFSLDSVDLYRIIILALRRIVSVISIPDFTASLLAYVR
jgi:hypothetical protein